jgi:hypothetical protein
MQRPSPLHDVTSCRWGELNAAGYGAGLSIAQRNVIRPRRDDYHTAFLAKSRFSRVGRP